MNPGVIASSLLWFLVACYLTSIAFKRGRDGRWLSGSAWFVGGCLAAALSTVVMSA